MALSSSRLAFLLSQSQTFQGRVQMLLARVASDVTIETGKGATHAARYAFARTVLNSPQAAAATASVFLAQAPNIITATSMEDEGPRCSATDAVLLAQVQNDWDKLAGVDAGN